MSELKPTPCNSQFGHTLEIENYTATAFRVKCACGKKGSTAETKEQAVILWDQMNPTRPTPDTGIGQGEAVKWLEKIKEQCVNLYGIIPPKLVTEKELDEAWNEDAGMAQVALIYHYADEALKASSAPALKQEACGEPDTPLTKG